MPQEDEARLQLALEAGRMGTWDWDVRTGTVHWSPNLEALHGLPVGSFPGTYDAFLVGVHPDDRAGVVASITRTLADGADHHIEYRIHWADGSVRWLEGRGRLFRDADGQPVHMMGVCMDVTERKRTEEEIRQLTAELEQRGKARTSELEVANKELEAFSFAVSHDLRAPLRALDGFSRILLNTYSDRLDEDGKDYLRRIRAASQRLDQLIKDLLKLAQAGRGELRQEKVDLSALAQAIAAELKAHEPQRGVEFLMAPGLEAVGDARLLRVMLDNLLGNAWKFTAQRAAARIEFGAAILDGQRAYFVRDNGAGFDMAYAGKLFLPFQRLHAAAEFPGTGIGLATVQRIVQRHGGRIWAEGAVDQGATFYFTLQG